VLRGEWRGRRGACCGWVGALCGFLLLGGPGERGLLVSWCAGLTGYTIVCRPGGGVNQEVLEKAWATYIAWSEGC